MASSSLSSSQKMPSHHLLNPYGGGGTAAPPPTPSTQSTSDTSAAAADTLSRLLHRLPPTLSFPTRFSPRATTPTTISTTSPLPTISLSSTASLTSSSFELGYFQLGPTDHPISLQLAESAESEALSLFDSPLDQKHALFPKEWPFGLDDSDDGDHTTSFCLDSCRLTTTESASLSLTSLAELTRELEKVGLHVVEKLACSMGFENPFRENGAVVGPSSQMWISLSESGEKMGRVYPYVVGLQYQIKARKWSLGSVDVEPEVGSVLVTLGDIAQVWSNGKLKKVRGRPAAILEDTTKSESSRCVSMTMLLTLPLENTVSPLNLLSHAETHELEKNGNHNAHQSVEANNEGNEDDNENDQRVFNTFSFEDYAWRVYHDRVHLKDPLDRYRTLHN